MARVLGAATAGVEPRLMGIGPLPATLKLLDRLGHRLAGYDVIELNEAFASQALAVLRGWGVPDDDHRVNPHGGAIALGHPLGASGARITGTAALDLADGGGVEPSPRCASVSARASRSRSRLCRARQPVTETLARECVRSSLKLSFIARRAAPKQPSP